MAHKLRLAAPKNLQSVVEWRFPKAHEYWDDPGKLIASIEATFPGLECQGLTENDGFRFTGESKGLTAATFLWDKCSVTQLAQNDLRLGASAQLYWAAVSSVLKNAASPSRVGHRTWVVFETDSRKDAARWLDHSSAMWDFATDSARRLGAPQVGGSVLRTYIQDMEPTRRMRLEFQAGTMNVKQRPYHGVIVDVDLAVEKATAAIPASGEMLSDFEVFVAENLQFLRERVIPLFK